jgi:hypothetical protein
MAIAMISEPVAVPRSLLEGDTSVYEEASLGTHEPLSATPLSGGAIAGAGGTPSPVGVHCAGVHQSSTQEFDKWSQTSEDRRSRSDSDVRISHRPVLPLPSRLMSSRHAAPVQPRDQFVRAALMACSLRLRRF